MACLITERDLAVPSIQRGWFLAQGHISAAACWCGRRAASGCMTAATHATTSVPPARLRR